MGAQGPAAPGLYSDGWPVADNNPLPATRESKTEKCERTDRLLEGPLRSYKDAFIAFRAIPRTGSTWENSEPPAQNSMLRRAHTLATRRLRLEDCIDGHGQLPASL